MALASLSISTPMLLECLLSASLSRPQEAPSGSAEKQAGRGGRSGEGVVHLVCGGRCYREAVCRPPAASRRRSAGSEVDGPAPVLGDVDLTEDGDAVNAVLDVPPADLLGLGFVRERGH